MNKRLSVLLAVLVGVLVGALVAGSALMGASARTPSTRDSSAAVSGARHTKTCAFKRLPAKLRTDLKAARALPVGERRAAVKKILEAARAGDYGKRAQRIVEKRLERRKRFRMAFPASLKADLAKARHLPAGQRRAALLEIRKDALAGKYGEMVQKLAEHRKDHRAACKVDQKSTGNA